MTQPNLGGAGGFTRGLYEVIERRLGAEHANVIFMDDDILCEPEIVVRLNAFANRTPEPTIVGAQMLYLLHPTQVLVGAEYADLDDLGAGKSARARSASPTHRRLPRRHQERPGPPGRRGLQRLVVVPDPRRGRAPGRLPAAAVLPVGRRRVRLPRARRTGFATVTLPGAGVWHADFRWKDWDDWHRYFNLRNAMITAALHSRLPGPADRPRAPSTSSAATCSR